MRQQGVRGAASKRTLNARRAPQGGQPAAGAGVGRPPAAHLDATGRRAPHARRRGEAGRGGGGCPAAGAPTQRAACTAAAWQLPLEHPDHGQDVGQQEDRQQDDLLQGCRVGQLEGSVMREEERGLQVVWVLYRQRKLGCDARAWQL